MSEITEQELQLSLQDKYISIFPEDNGTYPNTGNELWLAQPFAQKVVKSTTSSSSFELPDTLQID